MKTSAFVGWACAAGCFVVSSGAHATTLRVGPGQMYATPSAAAAAARDGDIVEIAPGTYRDVATWTANNLTLRGVGGRPHLDALGLTISNRKAIWVIQGSNTVVENIEFSGAAVPDMNGAGIRLEGPGLTVRGCFFHDNEDGILAGDNATSDVVIEFSEFHRNGAGDGQSHNLYINHVRSLTFRGNWTHAARVGHLLKSRALLNFIAFNRITGEDGDESYEIDLPNGGLSYVIGNVVQQPDTSQNSTIVSYAAEGGSNPIQQLYVVNNTFVNDRAAGAVFIRLTGNPMARVVNNLFVGNGTPVMGVATMATNVTTMTPGFVNRAMFDYHLTMGSPAVNAGSDPGMAGTVALTPTTQYVHPAALETRMAVGAIDVGAYEFGSMGMLLDGGGPVPDASGTPDVVAPADAPSGTDTGGMVADAASDGTSGPDVGTASDGGADAAGGDGGTTNMRSGCGCRVVARGSRDRARSFVAAAGIVVFAAGTRVRGRRRRRTA